MTFKPAHKEDDPAKAPGQIRNDITLADYVQHKTELTPVKPKMTFDAWYALNWKDKHEANNSRDDSDSLRFIMSLAWYTGQENK